MGYLSDLDGIRPNGDAPTKYDFLYPEEALFLVENVIKHQKKPNMYKTYHSFPFFCFLN